MYVLGINCGHDASAALVKDGHIVAILQEERKSRIKHQNGFPTLAINSVLEMGGIGPKDVDFVAIASNDRRWQSIKELIMALTGRRFYSCTGIVKRIKTAIAENTRNYFRFRRNIKKVGLNGKKIFYCEHHLCHASSAYRTSGLDKALIVTMDGVGDDAAVTVNVGESGKITRLSETKPDDSLGLMYQAVTESLGFMPVEGEYKTMGLAAYGDGSKLKDYFKDIIKCKGDKLVSKYLWESEWRFPAPTIVQHKIFKKLLDDHSREDIAAGCQLAAEEIMCEFVNNVVDSYGIQDVCGAGGVFLNVKGNKLIREKSGARSLFVYPDSGDAGLSLGAALELYYEVAKEHVKMHLEHTYFGTECSNEDIKQELSKHDLNFSYFENIEKETAKLLSEGHVIGWFQGRMEMGPRALGNRSVLADSRNEKIKEKINKHLKKREWFVPFAPSVLDEDAHRFVKDLKEEALFMLMAYDAKEETKSLIPAVVHVDGTLRPQVVKKDINPRYWNLIREYKDITGIGVVVNTSFNRHRLPIVESPKDAIEHLINGHIEKLVIGNYLVELK